MYQHLELVARVLVEVRAGEDPWKAFRWAAKRYAEAGFERTEPANLPPGAIWAQYTVGFLHTP